MRDPYLYEDIPVLKNKLDIRIQDELENAEADYVVYRLKDLAMNPMPGDYNTEHLMKMDYFLFQDLYEWAGKPRIIAIYKEEDVLGGMSVEKYKERRRIQSEVKELFDDTKYGTEIGKIIDIIQEKSTPKVLYLDTLKRFGKKDGLEIYSKIKEVV